MFGEDWPEWSATLAASDHSQSHKEIQNQRRVTPHDEKEVFAKLTFTEEQENDLREAFNSLDHLGEGKIKADDFRVVIKALGYEPTKEELLHMVNAVDKGNTGKLSFENFQTAIMRKIMSLDTDGDIMKSFRLFDMDDSGLISFENVKKVTEIIGTYLTDQEIEEMIDDADKDFDGFTWQMKI
ncbi:uncharacterized protein LOC128676552 isoform X4 [Plodia interpunctella]|uniref:uncharacterized protein LOC128676552 isoform X4 n=1 Tax=Plodia interpunctella TaxID=58824 RepID=UPI003101A421